MVNKTKDVKAEGTGHQTKAKRPNNFWAPFSSWWRSSYEENGRRPNNQELRAWYEENIDTAWPVGMAPSCQDLLKFAKGMRTLAQVKVYFRKYRRAHSKGQEVVPQITKQHPRAMRQARSKAAAPTSSEMNEQSEASGDDEMQESDHETNTIPPCGTHPTAVATKFLPPPVESGGAGGSLSLENLPSLLPQPLGVATTAFNILSVAAAYKPALGQAGVQTHPIGKTGGTTYFARLATVLQHIPLEARHPSLSASVGGEATEGRGALPGFNAGPQPVQLPRVGLRGSYLPPPLAPQPLRMRLQETAQDQDGIASHEGQRTSPKHGASVSGSFPSPLQSLRGSVDSSPCVLRRPPVVAAAPPLEDAGAVYTSYQSRPSQGDTHSTVLETRDSSSFPSSMPPQPACLSQQPARIPPSSAADTAYVRGTVRETKTAVPGTRLCMQLQHAAAAELISEGCGAGYARLPGTWSSSFDTRHRGISNGSSVAGSVGGQEDEESPAMAHKDNGAVYDERDMFARFSYYTSMPCHGGARRQASFSGLPGTAALSSRGAAYTTSAPPPAVPHQQLLSQTSPSCYWPSTRVAGASAVPSLGYCQQPRSALDKAPYGLGHSSWGGNPYTAPRAFHLPVQNSYLQSQDEDQCGWQGYGTHAVPGVDFAQTTAAGADRSYSGATESQDEDASACPPELWRSFLKPEVLVDEECAALAPLPAGDAMFTVAPAAISGSA